MKSKVFVLAAAWCITFFANAQDRSVYRKGYVRFGINKLGNELDLNLSPRENIFDNRYGTGTGYVFEFGHIYYFRNRTTADQINYGLDWTIISLNYNKMEKWENYAIASGVSNAYVDGSKTAASISTKLGPTVSINPIENLVIDLRFQVVPTIRFFDFAYAEDDVNPESRYFSFTNESSLDEDYDGDAVKNRLAFGVATGFGITVRRKAIGLSLDYITGKVNSSYDAYDVRSGNTFGKQKILANVIQFKLNLSL
jgi:hypothetical protein